MGWYRSAILGLYTGLEKAFGVKLIKHKEPEAVPETETVEQPTSTEIVTPKVDLVPTSIPFTKLTQVGSPSRILGGHDNGIVIWDTVNKPCLVTGDGPIPGGKAETAIYYLNGNNPKTEGHWILDHATGGKCYGGIFSNGTPYLLKSLEGSLYKGSQHVRLYDVLKRTFIGDELQKYHATGVNWFFVQGERFNGRVIHFGCISYAKQKFWDFVSPVFLWEASIGSDGLVNVKRISEHIKGLDGPRRNYATTVSITQIGGRYIAAIGDAVTGMIYQFYSDNLLGPYTQVRQTNYKPPMKRVRHYPSGSKPEETFTAGPFTWNFFIHDGKIYESVTGLGDTQNDAIFICEVTRS